MAKLQWRKGCCTKRVLVKGGPESLRSGTRVCRKLGPLTYLQGIKSWGIILSGKEFIKKELGLQIYTDTAFGNNPIYRFLTGGHVILAGGGPLFWKFKK